MKGDNIINKKKIIFAGVYVLAGVTILAFLITAFFQFPHADDFGFNMPSRDAWETTGSMVAALKGTIESTVHYYQSWAGSYATLFFCSFGWMIFSYQAHQVQILLYTILFFLSIAFFFIAFNKKYVKLPPLYVRVMYSLFVIIFFNFTPREWLTETMQWLSAICGYTLPLTWMLLFFSLDFLEVQQKWKRTLRNCCLVVLVILIPGAHINLAIPMMACVLGYLCTKIYGFIRKKTKDEKSNIWFSIALVLVLCVLFAANLLSPGNAFRQAAWGDSFSGSIIKGIFYTVQTAYRILVDTFVPSWVLPISIAVSLWFVQVSKKTCLKFSHPLRFVLLAALIYMATLFPYCYSGPGLTVPPRVYFISYFTLLLLWFSVLFYFCGWYEKRNKNVGYISPFKVVGIAACLITALSVMVFLRGRYEGDKIYPHTAYIYRDLVNGAALHYGQTMSENWERLERKDVDTVVLVRPKPPVGVYESIQSADPQYWANEGFVVYFKKNIDIFDETVE